MVFEKDPDSGCEYYFQWFPATGEVGEATWEKPLDLMDGDEKLTQELALWQEFWSPNDGAPYYVHATTGETTWRKPDVFRVREKYTDKLLRDLIQREGESPRSRGSARSR